MLEEHLAGGRAGLPVPRDQAGNPTYAEKVAAAELELDWEKPATTLRRTIRLGRAWTTFRGRRVRVLSAGPAPASPGVLDPGELSGTVVGAGAGSRLELRTLQPEGKRPMDAAAWLNGVHPASGERLGT